MKIIKYYFTAILLSIVSINNSFALDVKTYRNDVLGFEISYPSYWEESESPGNTPFLIRNNTPNKLASISIDATNFEGNKQKFMYALKTYPNKFLEKYKKRFQMIELIESGETHLGSFPAYLLSYIYTMKNLNTGVDIACFQILCIRENRLYSVNFETYMSFFEDTIGDFENIISTFNFR